MAVLSDAVLCLRHLAAAIVVAAVALAGAGPASAQDAAPSAPGLATPRVAPCTPFGLLLTWSASLDDVAVARYDVLVARPGRLPELAATVGAARPQPASYTYFLDGAGPFKLFDGETYTVWIRAVDSAGLQTPSAPQAVATAPATPVRTTGLQGGLVQRQVPLRWDAHPSACSFVVHRDGVAIAQLPAGATAHADAAPLHGRSTYGVHPVGRAGSLGEAATVTVSEPLPAVGARATCAWRTTPISARRLHEVNLASVCLMNHRRVREGLQPMWVDERLEAAAGRHARDQAARNYFSHTNPDGCDPTCRAKRAGYPVGTGENLFAGPPTAAETVDGWMRSAGHRINILDPEYRTVGSATALGGVYRRQWVQTFGPIGAPLSAISGLEPRFQGRANPDAPAPAELRIRDAKLTRAWRLRLTATISARADGGRVRFRVEARGRTVSYAVRIKRGRARLIRTLPGRLRSRPLTVTASYAGGSRVRAASIRRRFS